MTDGVWIAFEDIFLGTIHFDHYIPENNNIILDTRYHCGLQTLSASLNQPKSQAFQRRWLQQRIHINSKAIKTSFMLPLLHQGVVNAISYRVASTWPHKKGSHQDSSNYYQTSVIGKFNCSNNSYSKDSLHSKKVAIVIREYPPNGYNTMVFNRCYMSCNKLN